MLEKPEKVIRQEAENKIREMQGAELDDAVSKCLGLDELEPVSTSHRFCGELAARYLMSVGPEFFVEEDGTTQVYGWSAKVGYDPQLLNWEFSALGSNAGEAICRVILLKNLTV